jgi:hypothetical protein
MRYCYRRRSSEIRTRRFLCRVNATARPGGALGPQGNFLEVAQAMLKNCQEMPSWRNPVTLQHKGAGFGRNSRLLLLDPVV